MVDAFLAVALLIPTPVISPDVGAATPEPRPATAQTPAPEAADTPAVTDADAVRDQARARLLFTEGMGAFERADFDAARERFEDAFLLDPRPVLLYNLARASEEAGDAEHALLCYRQLLERWPASDDRPEVERRVRILATAIEQAAPGRIAVIDAPEDAAVYIDEAPAERPDSAGWSRIPGEYAVKLVTPDGAAFDAAVTVRPGQTTAVSFIEPDPLSTQTILGWSSMATGAALLGLSAWTWSESHTAADRWFANVEQLQLGDTSPGVLRAKERAADDVERYGIATQALWITGGVAIAAGLGLVLFDEPDSTRAVGLVPLPEGAALGGTF